jgi:hypothetical protein
VAIRVNGKEMTEAVLKSDQFEMRILEMTPDRFKVSIKSISDVSFNFVPRFIAMVYPDRPINAKDSGILAVPPGKTVETVIQFQEKLRIERLFTMELRYGRKKLADIAVD